MSLSGLWGGDRQPRNWLDRVAPTKEKLAGKTSLHLIHGQDVARSILAVHHHFNLAAGQRFVRPFHPSYLFYTLISHSC